LIVKDVGQRVSLVVRCRDRCVDQWVLRLVLVEVVCCRVLGIRDDLDASVVDYLSNADVQFVGASSRLALVLCVPSTVLVVLVGLTEFIVAITMRAKVELFMMLSKGWIICLGVG
jgi:hypothetical protein